MNLSPTDIIDQRLSLLTNFMNRMDTVRVNKGDILIDIENLINLKLTNIQTQIDQLRGKIVPEDFIRDFNFDPKTQRFPAESVEVFVHNYDVMCDEISSKIKEYIKSNKDCKKKELKHILRCSTEVLYQKFVFLTDFVRPLIYDVSLLFLPDGLRIPLQNAAAKRKYEKELTIYNQNHSGFANKVKSFVNHIRGNPDKKPELPILQQLIIRNPKVIQEPPIRESPKLEDTAPKVKVIQKPIKNSRRKPA